jgi:hypothetical protein
MSVRLTPKRGTDSYRFAMSEQFANEGLNANTFFGKLRGQPISKVRQDSLSGGV